MLQKKTKQIREKKQQIGKKKNIGNKTRFRKKRKTKDIEIIPKE